jgi:two-component system chemotaxis response regulator CheB
VNSHDVVVVGASTGGVEALIRLVGGLPPDLPASVFIVLHLPPGGRSYLREILARSTSLAVESPRDRQPIERGHVYVALPDYHLLVDRGTVRLGTGPHENRTRPSIDPLFRSAARAYGPRAVGVILTGALNDGTSGMIAIKRQGGVAIVQDPQDAYFPSMPASVLEYVSVDYCLPLRDIPGVLTTLAHAPVQREGVRQVPEDIEIESKIAQGDIETLARERNPGQLSSITCPECHGPLWEQRDGKLLRFRCRIGHAYTAESLGAASGESVEDALAVALNALVENAHAADRLAEEARQRNRVRMAAHYGERAASAMRHAEIIRQVLARKDVDLEDIEEDIEDDEWTQQASISN